MTNYPSMDRLAELQQLIADFAKVERVPHLADTGRRENDVEHSYGLAMTCWYLHDKIPAELDLSKILQYALSHDIVELHAGDTYAFDTEAMKTKDARERDALVKLRADWPDFEAITQFAEGYMNRENEEAKFVKAVDKLLPVLMFELTNNPKKAWQDRNISLEKERENKVTIHVSEKLSPYYEKLLTWLDERGNIPKV